MINQGGWTHAPCAIQCCQLLPAHILICPPARLVPLRAHISYVCLQAFRGIAEVHALVDALCINATIPAIVLTQVWRAECLPPRRCLVRSVPAAAAAALPGRLFQTEQHMIFFSIVSSATHTTPGLMPSYNLPNST